MKQQINLYQDVLLEKKPPLNSAFCVKLFCGALLLLISASFVLGWQERERQTWLAEEIKLKATLAKELEVLKKENPPRLKNPKVDQELRQLLAERAGRERLIDFFDSTKPSQNEGFSAVLDGLARHPFPGVWLSLISLDHRAKRVALGGSALRADQVPSYLDHLGEKEVLKGQTFARLSMERVESTGKKINFRLESTYGAADEH